MDKTQLQSLVFELTALSNETEWVEFKHNKVIPDGTSRVETIKEQTGGKGYATGFEGAIDYINDQLPHNEQIGQALRSEVRMYPGETCPIPR